MSGNHVGSYLTCDIFFSSPIISQSIHDPQRRIEIIDRSTHRTRRRLRSPDWIPDDSVHCNQNLAWSSTIPVFTEPDSLPSAKGDSAVTDGQSQVGAKQTGLGVGRHVVRPLTAVLEWDRLRHQSVEHHLHVVPHVRVPVLVDGQTGAGVEELDVHDPHLKLSQFRQASQNLLGDEVDPAVLRSEVKFPLQPGVGSDGEAGPAGVPRHDARLSESCRGRS